MRTIAQIIHDAADYELAAGPEDDNDKMKYSCNAIRSELEREPDVTEDRIFEGLEAMGCDTKATNLFKKLGYNDGSFWETDPETQGARYIWLKFAALMAEEQGV